MIPFRVAARATYFVLGLIEGVVEWNDRRKAAKAAKKQGLPYRDVAHIRQQIEAATARRGARTVVLPRRPPSDE